MIIVENNSKKMRLMPIISSQEPTFIQTLLEWNYSVRSIDRFVNRSPSTVSVETQQATSYS